MTAELLAQAHPDDGHDHYYACIRCGVDNGINEAPTRGGCDVHRPGCPHWDTAPAAREIEQRIAAEAVKPLRAAYDAVIAAPLYEQPHAPRSQGGTGFVSNEFMAALLRLGDALLKASESKS